MKMLFLVIGLLSSSIAYSASTGVVKIKSVEATDQFFTVYLESAAINTENCEDANKIVFWKADFPNGYESMLSVALAAHMSGKDIHSWISSCKMGPWGKTLPKPGSIVVY